MIALKPLLSISLNSIRDIQQTLRPFISIDQVVSVRYRKRPCHPPIRGKPRPWPYLDKKQPEPHKYNWQPIYPLDGKYTIAPLKIKKLGGRDPETGRVVVKTIGGGNKKYFRWIDYKKTPNEDGTPFVEKVFNVRYDPLRTSKLALVAGGDKIRWIIASETMEPGDIITTYAEIPRNPIRPKEGDSHPVGALPIGTKVHNVEVQPGEGGHMVRYAGDFAEVVRRVGKKNYLLWNKYNREVCIDQKCMVTVGRVSNPYHHLLNRMCPQRSRWLGRRPRSGAWHKKDGYCGRKIKPPKPLLDFTSEVKTGPEKSKELYIIQAFE